MHLDCVMLGEGGGVDMPPCKFLVMVQFVSFWIVC